MSDRDELAPFLTRDQPFGPIATEDIYNDTAKTLLFNVDNEIHREIIRRRPSFLVGRRGAGKTALLRESFRDPKLLAVELNSSQAFASVADLIKHISSTGRTLFVAQHFAVWEAALWHAVFHAIFRVTVLQPESKNIDSDRMSRYLTQICNMSDPEKDANSAINAFAALARRRIDLSAADLMDELQLIHAGDTFYADARAAAVRWLEAASRSPIVLLDSIEDFDLFVERHDKAFAGLLYCIGAHARSEASGRSLGFSVQMSIPAELWNEISLLASNPLKDFASRVVLRWRARELMTVAAERLRHFLVLTGSDLRHHAQDLDPHRAEHARKILLLCLPPTIRNGLGTDEDTIAYLMRHTQLLPRHLLFLLNSIWLANYQLGGSAETIAAEAVVSGVRDVEGQLVREIMKSYRLVHASAEVICESAVPELPLAFSDAELHQVFNRHLKRVADGMDYADVKALMVRIGCLGRVMERSGRYVVGEFEYTAPHRLHIGSDEELCVHPLFAGVYQSKSARNPQPNDFAIYPYGSEVDESTEKDWR